MHLICNWRLFELVSTDPTCCCLLDTPVVFNQFTSGSLNAINNAKQLFCLNKQKREN